MLRISLAGTVLWIWALVDVIRIPDTEYRAGSQLAWILVVVFTGSIGAIIYLAIGRPQRLPEQSSPH